MGCCMVHGMETKVGWLWEEDCEAKILLLSVRAIDMTENSEIATITRFDPTIDCE